MEAYPLRTPTQIFNGHHIQEVGIREEPKEKALLEWMKYHLEHCTQQNDFEDEMDKALLHRVNSQNAEDTIEARILRVKGMLKIWTANPSDFKFRVKGGGFPEAGNTVRIEVHNTVWDFLRWAAAILISENERKIFEMIEASYLRKGEKKEAQKGPACWLILWQMCLIYRQALKWMSCQLQAPTYTVTDPGALM